MTELKKTSGGIDIKLDSGGIEEIEFVVQYLQLRNADRSNIFYQDTISALRSLHRNGDMDRRDMTDIIASYVFLRTVESYLRLSLKGTVREDDREIMYLSRFTGYSGSTEFISDLNNRMGCIAGIAERLYDT
jgi:glutamate-ammonia-ligase adenylyltransferase